MRVRCKAKRGVDLVLPYYDPAVGKPADAVFHLTVGRCYTVYALGLEGAGTWVYIADDAFVDGPRRHPLCLFDVEDAAVSKSWEFAIGRDDGEHRQMLAPAAWFAMRWFFNRVVDGDAEAVDAFARMKRSIDGEAR